MALTLASDHEVALAFIARRQAQRAMSAARWCHLLSLELGWMNPGQARAFVEGAVRAGLLAQDGEHLRLVIDPQAVEVPRGFRPKPDAAARAPGPVGEAPNPAGQGAPGAAAAVAPPEPDPFLAWLARLAAHTGKTREHVLGQVAQLQESMGGLLTAEAAVLVLARRAGLPVAEAAQKAAEGLVRPAARAGGRGPAAAGSR